MTLLHKKINRFFLGKSCMTLDGGRQIFFKSWLFLRKKIIHSFVIVAINPIKLLLEGRRGNPLRFATGTTGSKTTAVWADIRCKID